MKFERKREIEDRREREIVQHATNNTVQYNSIQNIIAQYSTVQYNAIKFNIPQYNTRQYND
jgi:hypothetical protein